MLLSRSGEGFHIVHPQPGEQALRFSVEWPENSFKPESGPSVHICIPALPHRFTVSGDSRPDAPQMCRFVIRRATKKWMKRCSARLFITLKKKKRHTYIYPYHKYDYCQMLCYLCTAALPRL